MAKKIAIGLVVAILLIILIGGLSGCRPSKVPNRIYKKLATDAVPLDNEYKKNVMAQKCNVLFPIVPITIIKDSIRTKIVKVQDNTLVNKLKAKLAKGCPTLNIDSIYNELPLDTVFIDHYKTKTVTQKDTISLYNMANSNDELHSKVNALNAEISILNKHIEDANKQFNNANKDKNKWKLYFFLLLGIGIIYKVAKIYLSKSFTLPKIF